MAAQSETSTSSSTDATHTSSRTSPLVRPPPAVLTLSFIPSARDVPVVQACALVFAATYIVLNLIADVLGIVTNPRLMHPK